MKPKILAVVVCMFCWTSCRQTEPGAAELAEFHGSTMGTVYTVKAVLVPSLEREQLKTAIERTLGGVNRLMSTYDPDSELSRFNRNPGGQWFPVSLETIRVFEVAERVGRLSGGALDITVGPLVNLWGFGPQKRRETLPSEEDLKTAMDRTGLRRIMLQADPPAVWKEKQDVYCDLAAVAKGYGVDRVTDLLREMGVHDCMVEVGGEVRVTGKKPGGENWRIGVAVPDGSRQAFRILHLADLAMATSGDYFNYYERDGKRYSHTIDPKTGRPIEHNLASVTVVHQNCAEADAWATALNVLGPEKGMALAERQKLPVLMIVREVEGFVERYSRAMTAYIKE